MTIKYTIMIKLEDFHEDILGKAMRGLSVGKNGMAERLGVAKSLVENILSGDVDRELIHAMSSLLNLDSRKLLIAAAKEWAPALVELKSLYQFNLPFGEMLVNAYVVWCEKVKKAWVFDTGPLAEPVLGFLEYNNLQVDAIFLTHTHRDHIACLDRLLQKTGTPAVFVHESELLEGCNPITEGFKYNCGSLSLKALHTHGHSVGGMTYLVDGLERKIAVVGDAIFAGSMGGGMVSYANALQTNRKKIMTLQEDTVLCPGHGPLTTVKEEKQYNPFFPEF